MPATIKGGKKPGRNDKCPCNSGLKFKHCHGDEAKRQLASKAANQVMMHLIMEEKHKRGLITDEAWNAYAGEPLTERIDYMVGTDKAEKPKSVIITGDE